jgi:STE24 endopeptidase
MKNLIWVGCVLAAFLVISTQLPPSADVVENAKRYFSDEVIETGRTFAWQRRWIYWGRTLTQFALIAALAFHPIGKRLAAKAAALAPTNWFVQLLLLGGVYFILSAALALPFSLASYFLRIHWGMSNQSLPDWIRDYAISLGIAAVSDLIVVSVFYAIVRSFPRIWWLIAGAASVIFGLAVALVLPVVVDPLFNTFTPISQTQWADFEPRIRALGERLKIEPSDIYVIDASRQTTASNAYFTGFGSTQRVVLYDNLLAKHSADEVDTIIAHEMGHWWHEHIVRGIFFGGVAATLGLYILFRHLNYLAQNRELQGAGDPAGLFRVLFLAQLAFAASLPVQNMFSRYIERQADEVSLDLAKKPQAFIDAEIRLAILNKSDVTPSRWNTVLFATHPPVVQRIHMAEQWERDHTAKK